MSADPFEQRRLVGDARAVLWGGIAALMLAMGIGRFVYTPILPDMLNEGQLSIAQAGWIASANFVGYLAGALIAALIVTPRQRLVWLRLAIVASVVTTLAMAISPSIPIWLAVRFLSGLASAFVLVFFVGFAGEAFARAERPQWAGWFFAGVGLGIAASAVLVEAMQQMAINWRGLWLAAGDLAAVLALVAWYGTMRLDLPRTAAAAAGGDGRDRLFTPAFALLLVAYFCLGLGYIIDATYLPTLMRALPALAGFGTLAWLVVGLSAAPSNPLWDSIARRTGRPLAMIAAFVLQAVGLLVPLVWSSVPGVAIAAVALGGTFMGITAMGLGHARALSGSQAGRAVALMTASFGLGQIAGPPLAGALVGPDGSFLWPTVLASAVLVLGAVLVALSILPLRPVAPRDPAPAAGPRL